MADKYTLTKQPKKSIKILDFIEGKRRWPEARRDEFLNDEGTYTGIRGAGELPDLSGTFLRKKEDTIDERNKFANKSERFQTKTDYDRRRIAYAENKFQEIIDSTDSGKMRESYRYNKDDYIRKFLDEFDRLSLLEGERMAQGGIVSLNQMTRPIGYI
mgnify:FL=1